MSPEVTYQEVIEHAKKGSPYYQGLLGIFLRSGEFGSSVNIALSKQWSEVSYRNAHPFGSYNLANIAMLEGDFAKATQFYQDAALLLQRKASDGDAVSMYCMGEIDFQVIPTNVPRALEWFKKSSDLGYPQAQATLGALYLKGLPGLLPKNTKETLLNSINIKSKPEKAKPAKQTKKTGFIRSLIHDPHLARLKKLTETLREENLIKAIPADQISAQQDSNGKIRLIVNTQKVR